VAAFRHSPAGDGDVAGSRAAGGAFRLDDARRFFPVWFVLAVSYPALALTKVRSFLEHRAADDPLARSVINEAGLFWRVLFLNLNYHSVHHDLPGVPWYGLKAIYQQNREAYRERNHGFLVRGYGEWLRQFWARPVDVTVHPENNRKRDMSNLLAFPMYAVDRADTRALWLAVGAAGRARCARRRCPRGPESIC
jgi:fatty acid desaturase